jgi:hypothetical protein
VNLAAGDAQQEANAAAASARSKWAQLRADATARMDDLQARIDKRAGQIDANVAAEDAAWAEDDAAAALDYASWTVDNARLAVLDAIDARRTRACAHSITLRGNQARLRLPPKAARAVRSPRTRPRRCINRAKRTLRRGRTTPPSGGMTSTNPPREPRGGGVRDRSA